MLISSPSQAFIGGIVVVMGRANEIDEVKVSFAADAQVETEENIFNTRLYYRPGMVRDDVKMGGQQMTTIQRFDLGKVWVLMGQGMYMEHGIGQSKQAPEYKLIERSIVGTETIDGMETTKYKTVYEGPDGRFGGFTWFNEDNIAVKGFMISESRGEKQRILFTVKNLEYGEQPESLFALPAGARRFDMPGLGDMMNMGGADSPR